MFVYSNTTITEFHFELWFDICRVTVIVVIIIIIIIVLNILNFHLELE